MRKYERDLGSGRLDAVPAQHKDLYDRYLLGLLAQELDALTAQHGHGQLRERPERLGPMRDLARQSTLTVWTENNSDYFLLFGLQGES